MTIADALRSLSAYPIPESTLQMVAEGQGLSLDNTATTEVLEDVPFKLATAQLLSWLSLAPDIAQGGQNYAIPVTQRKEMAERARLLMKLYNPSQVATEDAALAPPKVVYGYKGSRL